MEKRVFSKILPELLPEFLVAKEEMLVALANRIGHNFKPCLLLGLLVYNVTLVYGHGKQMEWAATLSPAYLPNKDPSPLQTEAEAINMAQDLAVSAA